MLDLSHLATSTRCDVQIFSGTETASNTQWKTWTRPRGTSMLYAFCLGSGAPGGAGFTGSGGGGGGGGSSAQTRILIPSILLPETLYLQVGSASGSPTLSYIAVAPNTTATNVVVVSGAAVPTAGGAGTGAAVGSAGTAGTVATTAAMPLGGLGLFSFIAGQNGTAGGAITGGVGGAQTIPVTSIMTMGGTGGGGQAGTGFNGGLITSIAGSLLSEQRPQVALVATPDGSGGMNYKSPFFSFPGMGGASTNSGVGGVGGNGSWGSGGGGGGASAGTGSNGGAGGPGVIVMISW